MKTPLPGKFEHIPGVTDRLTSDQKAINQLINQLIDYLAELTEVVGGKNKMSYQEKAVRDLTPNLKEMLLYVITTESFQEHALQKPRVMLEDVEAIINRLIP